MLFRSGARCDGDLGIEPDEIGPSCLLEDSRHDCRHVTLAGMIRRYVGAVDVAISIEFDEARHIAIHNCNPRLLAIAPPAPFLSPRIAALNGSSPSVTLLLSVVIAGQLMNCVVVTRPIVSSSPGSYFRIMACGRLAHRR